jgi:hypothetical protein
MAPACILLDRTITFRSHPQETEPFDLGEKIAKGVVGATPAAELPKLPSREATEASIARYLLAMTPDLEVVEPPEVSRLTMLRPLSSDPIPNHLRDGDGADKNLVILSAGSYDRLAYSYYRCYLLLDLDADASSSSSLSTIPGIDYEVDRHHDTPRWRWRLRPRRAALRLPPPPRASCAGHALPLAVVVRLVGLQARPAPRRGAPVCPSPSRAATGASSAGSIFSTDCYSAIRNDSARSTRRTCWTCLLFSCPMAAPSATKTPGGRPTR